MAIFQPLVLWDVSFQLSFMATLVLCFHPSVTLTVLQPTKTFQ